jgi:hypothetical protein
MKRGFLNKSGNKKIPSSSTTRDPVSNLTEPTSIAAAVPQVPPKGIIRIPTGPIKDFHSSTPLENALANWPGLKNGGIYVATSLPPPPSQGMDVHSFCLFPPGVKEKVLALPNFPGPPFVLSMMQNKFRIGPVPDAGKGMFSTTDLKAGDLIMAERPFLVAPAAFPYTNLKGFVHPDKIMEMAVEKLGPPCRDIFMKLHNCKGPDTPKIRGIVDTNSLELSAMPGHDVPYAGIFQNISRINHRSVTAGLRFSRFASEFITRLVAPLTLTYTGTLLRFLLDCVPSARSRLEPRSPLVTSISVYRVRIVGKSFAPSTTLHVFARLAPFLPPRLS